MYQVKKQDMLEGNKTNVVVGKGKTFPLVFLNDTKELAREYLKHRGMIILRCRSPRTLAIFKIEVTKLTIMVFRLGYQDSCRSNTPRATPRPRTVLK